MASNSYHQPPPQSNGGYPAQQQQRQRSPFNGTPNPQQQQNAPLAPFTGFKLGGAGAPPPPTNQRTATPGRRKWTVQQLRASDAIIPLQSGTNQFASQRGMTGFGTVRNTTTRVFDSNEGAPLPDEADPIIRLQAGTNQMASQRGMTGFGQPRDVAGKHIHRLHDDDPDFVDGQGPAAPHGYQGQDQYIGVPYQVTAPYQGQAPGQWQ